MSSTAENKNLLARQTKKQSSVSDTRTSALVGEGGRTYEWSQVAPLRENQCHCGRWWEHNALGASSRKVLFWLKGLTFYAQEYRLYAHLGHPLLTWAHLLASSVLLVQLQWSTATCSLSQELRIQIQNTILKRRWPLYCELTTQKPNNWQVCRFPPALFSRGLFFRFNRLHCKENVKAKYLPDIFPWTSLFAPDETFPSALWTKS